MFIMKLLLLAALSKQKSVEKIVEKCMFLSVLLISFLIFKLSLFYFEVLKVPKIFKN